MSTGRFFWLAGLLTCGITTIAVACGPDFPIQLLDDRAGNLKATPANGFAYEAQHLVSPGDGRLKPVEVVKDWYDDDQVRTGQLALLAKAEAQDLTVPQTHMLAAMRMSASGASAYDAGAGLPEEIRLYTAGAIDFRARMLDSAKERFDSVLALPEADRIRRSVWAAYMLGRIYAGMGDAAKASAAFRMTRDLVVGNTPDPMGLAVASLGEEAKLHLDAANALLADGHLPPLPDVGAKYSSEIDQAVGLYAAQAATGSNSGVQSLRIVAETLLGAEGVLSNAIADPTVQKLLVAFVLARVDDIPESGSAEASYSPNTDRNLPPVTTPNPLLLKLVTAIQQHGLDNAAGKDRLAALAYRTGQYDLAEQLAKATPGPLADWVRGKIAFQKGDIAAAAEFYSRAAKAFPAAGTASPLDPGNAKLLIGEDGVLALARGDYVAALDRLFSVGSTYWGDVAYVAERVLTVDELKSFVDAKVPAVQPVTNGDDQQRDDGWRFGADPTTGLRDLLARRLVREGRYDEAIGYFPARRVTYDDEGKKKLVDDTVRKDVGDYAAALKSGASAWSSVTRARALFDAAKLARFSGMDMMGYEGPPDLFAVDGSLDYGVGRQKLDGQLVTDGEIQRFAASTAKPDTRFHYRYIAVEQAARAADLLPPRSQAFAAVLCKASGWIIDRDAEAAGKLYARYLKDGAFVPWGNSFPRACPEPDFTEAKYFREVIWLRKARHAASIHGKALASGSTLLVAGLVAFTIARRRARRT